MIHQKNPRQGVFENDVFLTIYPEGFYSLEFYETQTSDIIRSFLVSYGKCRARNDEVILSDYENGFKMKGVFSGDQLVINDSFRFLSGLALKYYIAAPKLETTRFPFDFKVDLSLARKERENYNQHELVPLFFGEYVWADLRFWFHANDTYLLKFRDKVILSEGTWSRNGNIMILYDIALKCRFYAFITWEELICNQMIGSLRGSTFKYVT